MVRDSVLLFGRAIVRDPKVFLLDEPLSNLDAKLRTQMRTEISKLHKRLGTTFIYVTHDQTEAMTMGDRIVVMKDGFIQQVDTPQNLYEKPCNLFVAGFMGAPQMNFINATIVRAGEDYGISFGKYTITLQSLRIRTTFFLSLLAEMLFSVSVQKMFTMTQSSSREQLTSSRHRLKLQNLWVLKSMFI